MEPNKMENEFSTKLNQREIKPSAHAWERLDAMLNDAEDKKPVRSLKWLYLAAGFIGLMLMATLFFKQNEKTTPPENRVAVENVNEKQQNQTGNSIIPSPKEAGNENQVKESQIEPRATVPGSKYQNHTPLNKAKRSEMPALKIKGESQIAENTSSQPEKLKSEDQKIIINPIKVTVDEQIADIGTPKPQTSSVKVDANSLLSQVDGELELSFREKVIKTVSKNYRTVKVALANRNQE
jgi:hypothetical protein